MANAVVESVSPAETGVATGMNTIMRTIGGSIGAQVAASIVTGSLIAGTSFPQESGYAEAFAISAAVLVLAAIVALRIPRAGRGAEERTAEVSRDGSSSSPRPSAPPVQPRAGRA
jgi:sugar phosphate permease